MPKPKGKIPRIVLPAAPPIVFTVENWNTIEAAYGRKLSGQVREQILRTTREFLQLAKAEKTGSMDDAVQRARRLREYAQQLVNVITSRHFRDVTREYVDDEIALQYSLLDVDDKQFPARSSYVARFSVELTRFTIACDETLRVLNEASQHNYWPDGGAWDVWIRDLTSMLEAHGLPTAASKDTDKRPDRTSPFTSFVLALQTVLPKEHVRTRQAGALGVAIHKARQESKPLTAPRKARLPKSGRDTGNSAP